MKPPSAPGIQLSDHSRGRAPLESNACVVSEFLQQILKNHNSTAAISACPPSWGIHRYFGSTSSGSPLPDFMEEWIRESQCGSVAKTHWPHKTLWLILVHPYYKMWSEYFLQQIRSLRTITGITGLVQQPQVILQVKPQYFGGFCANRARRPIHVVQIP
jgi:hypothetical protein